MQKLPNKLTRLLVVLAILAMGAAIQAHEITLPGNFAQERIYSVITSRFFDADESNNFFNRERIDRNDPHFRGDFKGLAQKLSYIKELGFTAICITPPVENRGALDYMGFNAYDLKTFDPRLSSADFGYHDLITAAKDHGLKIIQTLVVNHCSNYGIRNLVFIPRLPLKFYQGDMQPEWPYIFNFGNYKHKFRMDNDNPMAPEWFKDYLHRDPWAAGPLVDPVTGATFPQHNLHPERFFSTNESDLPSSLFHKEGWLNAAQQLDVRSVQRRHLDENSIDLATENWSIKRYFEAAVRYYSDLGVDGIRIQFGRNSARQDLIHMIELWRAHNPDLYIFADVAPFMSGFGALTDDEPSELVPWWYTRMTQNPVEPELGRDSELAVMDYPLFKTFAQSIAMGHFNGVGDVIKNDYIYGNPYHLVTFFHNYDLGPEMGSLTRFSAESWKAACAYNLIWTLRGVPMLLMGEEIEFQKGMPQIMIAPEDRLAQTGKAYFGNSIDSDNITQTMNHPMFKHIQRLNQLRQAIPALAKGRMEQGNEFVSGVSFVRNYNRGESYAVVGLSAFIDQEITVNRVLPGTYTDAITGASTEVATDSLSISFEVKGNSAGIWVRNGPGKVGEDGEYLR